MLNVIRQRRADSFTIVSNELLRNPQMSFRARGLLAYLLSLPDGWKTDSRVIAGESKEGRDAIRTALDEIEAAGYLRRERVQGERGRWFTAWDLYDEPQPPTVTQGELLDTPTEAGFSGIGDAERVSPGQDMIDTVSPGRTEDGFPGAGFPGTNYRSTEKKKELTTGADAPDQARAPNAGDIVRIFVDAARAAGRGDPSGRLCSKVGRDAKRLLTDRVSIERLLAAAQSCGANGWDDLDRQMQRVGANGHGASANGKPDVNARRKAALDLALKRNAPAQVPTVEGAVL